MFSNNQKTSETKPILEERVETGQERQRTSKYSEIKHACFTFTLIMCMFAALAIGSCFVDKGI